MPLFDINWSRFAVWQLPAHWRKIRRVQFLLALYEPIRESYGQFMDFMTRILYEAKINGQVIKLERVLNDKFDPFDRRIYISDGDYYDAPTFFEEWKNEPVIFYAEGDTRNPVFWSTDALNNRVSVNFYVNVPADVYFDAAMMRALVTKYKIFGRTFEIRII